MPANEKQIGGTHYKRHGDLQPWDVVLKWNLGYLEGTALKYIARWRDKGGIDDIKKAIHFLEKLVETETQNGTFYNQTSQLAAAGKHGLIFGTDSLGLHQDPRWMEIMDKPWWPNSISGSESVQLQSVRRSTDRHWNGDVSNSNDAIPHWGLTKDGNPHT